MAPRVFIGVVTHEGSRFRDAAVAQVAALAERARARGWDVETTVNARDGYTVTEYPLDRVIVLRSALDQARLEYRWRRYLASGEGLTGLTGASRWARDALLLAGTAVVRCARYLGPWPFAQVSSLHGSRSIVRLLNIDLSHVDLLRRAQDADWALILEDDARAEDASAAMDTVLDAFDALVGTSVAFVNASRSIDHRSLGVAPLLGPSVAGRRSTRVPVTNTVCAVAYTASMLSWLPDAIESDGLLPAVPIDWRLNRAVMEASATGRLGRDSCVWLDPAPFVQGSMH